MACALTPNGFDWEAPTGSPVTIRLIAQSTTTLIGADYNGEDLTVADNATTFAVVRGRNLLQLALAGPQDTVEIVEDCGDGFTTHLFGYVDGPPHVLGFTIIGT